MLNKTYAKVPKSVGNIGFKFINLQNSKTENKSNKPNNNKKLVEEYKVADTSNST